MIDISWQDKITSVHRKYIYRLLKGGVSAKVIARAFQVTKEDIKALRAWMTERRLARVQSYLVERQQRNAEAAPDKAALRREFYAGRDWTIYRRRKTGERLVSIARAFGLSSTRVDQIIAKQFRWQKIRVWKYLERRAMRPRPAHVPPPPPPKRETYGRFIPKLKAGDHRKMLALYKRIGNRAEVARAFGVSNSTAAKVIKREEERQINRVKWYLRARRHRKYAWDAKKQHMEFEMFRGEG